MAGESNRDQCSKEGCSGCKHCTGGSMYDWQDKLQAEENEIDNKLNSLSLAQLKSAVKRRIAKEISEKLEVYKKELERALDEKS